MDRKMFGKKNVNSQSRVDRFVAPRSSLDDLRTRRFLHEQNLFKLSDMDSIRHTKYLERKRYANYLDGAFGLENIKPALQRQGPRNESNVFVENPADYSLQPWPCIPRTKRCLTSAGSVLDLPSFAFAPFTDLLDWGNNDILVAALGRNYYNWSWKTQNLFNRGLTINEVHACKFEPRSGEIIAFGTVNGVELHDVALGKWLLNQPCKCNTLGYTSFGEICSITCLDWSPTGNSFATGCTRGVLTAWNRDACIITWRRVQRTSMLSTRISPDARFIACMSILTNTIKILTWPSLQIYYTLNAEWTVSTLNWHPWRSSLLGISATSSSSCATLAVWDAAADRISAYTASDQPCYIDSALFNNLTGELVMSILTERTCRHSISSQVSVLVVLGDPYTVVDTWDKPECCYVDRIPKMMFSPDGTKLATATADEDLLIWKFVPENDKGKRRKSRKFSELPVYLDKAEHGFSVR